MVSARVVQQARRRMPSDRNRIIAAEEADEHCVYRDAFNKREKANEDYYVKQKEKEKYVQSRSVYL